MNIKIYFAFFLLFSSSGLNAQHREFPQLYPATFIYDPAIDKRDVIGVSIQGNFNGTSLVTKLKKDSSGIFKKTINLPEGFYNYSFILDVLNKGPILFYDRHQTISNAEEPDVFGVDKIASFYVGPGFNSIDNDRPGFFNQIKPNCIYHNPNLARDFSFATPCLTRIIMQALSGMVAETTLCYRLKRKEETPWKKAKMKKFDNLWPEWDLFSVTLSDCCDGVIEYYFSCSDNLSKLWIGEKFSSTKEDVVQNCSFKNSLTVKNDAPSWAMDALWYEIFPDRFYIGSNNQTASTAKASTNWPTGESLALWNYLLGWTQPTHNPFTLSNQYNQTSFTYIKTKIKEFLFKKSIEYKESLSNLYYGGNIQGMIEALPYLKELGVNAIYLTPMFVGKTAHKYRTLDLRHIDDTFGVKNSLHQGVAESSDNTSSSLDWAWTKSDLLFLDFLDEAHRQGFRVIMDLNLHSFEKESFWFQDVLKHRNKSVYADWFAIKNWNGPNQEITYNAWDEWLGSYEMPRLKITEDFDYTSKLKEFFIKIALRWLSPNGNNSKGLDGFRIDSPASVPIKFFWDFCNQIKEVKPDALIIAETWHGAHRWNRRDLVDGVQNLELATFDYDAFASKSSSLGPLSKYLDKIFNYSSINSVLSSMHLLDNHDTVRFVSGIANPSMWLNAFVFPYQFLKEPDSLAWKRFLQVIAYQFTAFGAPLIYYGDESGMFSGSDPFNRAPMCWQQSGKKLQSCNLEVFSFYQRMIALRKFFEPLRRGDFKMLSLPEEKGVFGFVRSIQDKQIFTILNRSAFANSIRVNAPYFSNKKFVNCLDDQQLTWDKESGKFFLNSKNSFTYSTQDETLELNLDPWETVILVETESNLLSNQSSLYK